MKEDARHELLAKRHILEKLETLRARYQPKTGDIQVEPRYEAVSKLITQIRLLPDFSNPADVRRILVGIEQIQFEGWRGKQSVRQMLEASGSQRVVSEIVMDPHHFQDSHETYPKKLLCLAHILTLNL